MPEPLPRLAVESRVSGDLVTLIVEGEFDVAQVEAFDEAAAVARDARSDVLVCLAATTLLDSSALGCLLRLHRDVTGDGGRMRVHAPRDFQTRLLRIAGLEDVIETADDCAY